MSRIRLPAALAAGALLAGVAQPTPAPAAQQLPMAGTFALDRSASDDLASVVEEGVELVESWWRRPFARGRLEDTNRPYQWTRIGPAGDGVAIETDLWSLEIPWDGGIDGWEGAEGDPVDVRAAAEGRLLRVTFRGAEGSRTNVYRLADGGTTLIVDVTIRSDRLRRPLTYELVYRRGRPDSTP